MCSASVLAAARARRDQLERIVERRLAHAGFGSLPSILQRIVGAHAAGPSRSVHLGLAARQVVVRRAACPIPASARSRRARGSPSTPPTPDRGCRRTAARSSGRPSRTRACARPRAAPRRRCGPTHSVHLVITLRCSSSSRTPYGTRPRAVLAADALVVVDQHDAVLRALVARARRAHRHARRILAVQAGLREVHGLRVRELADLERLHAVEEGAGRILVVGPLVRERRRPGPTCSTPCSS